MKATVSMINWHLPICEAITPNQIKVVFKPPENADIALGDELEIGLEKLCREQEALNQRTGSAISIIIKDNDVHDLRLPASHGGSRFPSLSRRLGS